MKKIVLALLSVCMIFATLTCINAIGSTNESVSVEYFEDGSYVIDEDSSGVALLATRTTKSKTSTYYASDGTAQWYIKVTGTFTSRNGVTECIDASVVAEVYSSDWKIARKSASYAGRTAVATAAVNQLLNGAVVNTLVCSLTLTCSSAGTFY